jgi:hypothetical protein
MLLGCPAIRGSQAVCHSVTRLRSRLTPGLGLGLLGMAISATRALAIKTKGPLGCAGACRALRSPLLAGCYGHVPLGDWALFAGRLARGFAGWRDAGRARGRSRAGGPRAVPSGGGDDDSSPRPGPPNFSEKIKLAILTSAKETPLQFFLDCSGKLDQSAHESNLPRRFNGQRADSF